MVYNSSKVAPFPQPFCFMFRIALMIHISIETIDFATKFSPLLHTILPPSVYLNSRSVWAKTLNQKDLLTVFFVELSFSHIWLLPNLVVFVFLQKRMHPFSSLQIYKPSLCL